MGKYIELIFDKTAYVGILNEDGNAVALRSDEILSLLNSPPPAPPGGIVWRRPGEAGRKHGAQYLVYSHPARYPYYWNWNELHKCWGDPACGSEDTHPWAEINPPAWEGEKP